MREGNASQDRIVELSQEVARLKEELSKFQLSEFNLDWSMLQASQESLREHMEIIKEMQLKYNWMWDRCKIVFFPRSDDETGTYPIEHNSFANKDSRYSIESKFKEGK